MVHLLDGRSALRSAAVGGALLGAFAFASPATAALGGATPSVFTSSPNLVSITANPADETVVYRFDRAVAPFDTLSVADFTIGGYDASATVTSGETAPKIVGAGDSVLVDFGGTDIDFAAVTYGTVEQDTVKGVVTNSKGNFPDSTRITGATTVSGTVGHTDGPDLLAATLLEDQEKIRYVFDQAVDEDNPPSPQNFGYVDVNGVRTIADAVEVDDNTVIADFGEVIVPVGPERAGDVSDTAKADIEPVGAPIRAAGYDDEVTGASIDSVTIAGASVAATPNLVSATLDTNGGSVTYVFDRTISDVNPGGFSVFLANGDRITGSGSQLLSDAKSVRVSFEDLDRRNEYVVYASVGSEAVTGATNDVPSTADGAPVGGNAGAQSSGYTTAPDAIQALVNPAVGQISVLFDARLGEAPNTAMFEIYTADGVRLTDASAASATLAAAPQPARVVLTVDDTTAAAARNIVIRPMNRRLERLGTIDDGEQSSTNIVSTLPVQPTAGTFRTKE